MSDSTPVVAEITSRILVLGKRRFMLDADLAELYGVETRALIQAVKRNSDRFPGDFMFKLTNQDVANLRSQSVISSLQRHGGRRTAPYAFTEQGVAMLSSVLNSARAIAVNIEIMRVFVRLREALAKNHELAQRLKEFEARVTGKFAEHDDAISAILSAIRELMTPLEPEKRPIGFVRSER